MKTLLASLSLSCVSAVLTTAEAAVLVTFDDSSGQVVATISGSFDTTGMRFRSGAAVTLTGRSDGLLATSEPYWRTDRGVTVLTGLSENPVSATTTFGYLGEDLYIPETAGNPAGVYSIPANASYTWAPGTTIASIGLGALTATPTTVWTANSSSDVIQFAIPEPSSMFLLGIAGLALGFNRRR